VGQKRKRELLKFFGSLKKVRAASVEELQRAPGMSRAAAEAVVKYFRGEPDPTPAAAPVEELQREDVAEDAASAELEEIASEEEASEEEASEEEATSEAKDEEE